MKKTVALILLILLVLASAAACSASADGQPSPENAQKSGEASAEDSGGAKEMTDPSGARIAVPDDVKTIVSLAPSLTQTLLDFGLGDKIVGVDSQTAELVSGIPGDAEVFDIVSPDTEKLAALAPDILLVSSLSLYEQEAPYQPLIDAGVCVVCVPTADDAEDIRSDIRFMGEALNESRKAEEVIAEMDAKLDGIAAVVAQVPDDRRKTVYFEIEPAPYMYSAGSGTYLNQLIEIAGGRNVLANEEGWVAVDGESVVAGDPDVIFTNVVYIDDPVGEIKSRDGWAGVKAVADGNVYAIDNMSSSLPNEHITVAVEEMAKALYPDLF